jgi:hypothetical protein
MNTDRYGHWRTTTFVAGLRASGIIAPFVLDGSMTGEAFRTYVAQVEALIVSLPTQPFARSRCPRASPHVALPR